MPPVGSRQAAIASVEAPVRWILPTRIWGRAEDLVVSRSGVADAMRPRVVPVNRHTSGWPALNRKQQAVIAGCSAVVEVNHIPVVLSDRRVFDREPPALVEIPCRGACCILHTGKSAWTQP